MTRKLTLAALLAAPALLLAACGASDEEQAAAGATDGELASALGDEIMVDPDLAGQNQGNSAIAAGEGDGTLPPEMLSPEAIERARAAARQIVGQMKKAPVAVEVAGKLPADAALAVASRAAAAPSANGGNCADQAEYTMQWAARLPSSFPVYPQGSVQEAAGTDQGSCALRVVNYVTAVPLDEVIDFYFTRATGAGFSAQRIKEDGDDVLGGTKGKSSYVVYARAIPSGGTSVDLVTHGS